MRSQVKLGRALSVAALLLLLCTAESPAAGAGSGGGSDSSATPAEARRGRLRLLLAPLRPIPPHESRWANDATAALRRELAALPWIEIVDPAPRTPGGSLPDFSDWSRAIGEARRQGCTAFLRGTLKACSCESDDARNPWQGWITIELKLDYVGDTPSVEASDEDYVIGPWTEALEVRVPEMVNGMILGLVPQLVAGLSLGGHVAARLDGTNVLLDRGLVDGLRVGARLTLVRPGLSTAAQAKTGILEVTSLAESTAIAVARSGPTPVLGTTWRWLPPRPVTGSNTLRGLVQGLGNDDRCCP